MDGLKMLKEEDVRKHNNQYLMALWYDQNGEWDEAHKIVQNLDDPLAFRIHAYLHRKEGDINNSKYWYDRAHMKYCDQITLSEEVASILMAMK